MNTTEKFCLKWNDFSENLISTFSGLRTDKDLTDMTLACEDGTEIEAHKIVLSAGSFFFRNMLMNKKKGTPIIYMRGLKSSDLNSIMDFLYFGEANIQEEELNSFLSLADELQITGLAGGGKNDKEPEKVEQKPYQYVTSKPKVPNGVGAIKEESNTSYKVPDIISEYTPEKSKQIVSMAENEDLKQRMTELINWNGETWSCTVCGKLASDGGWRGKANLQRHTQIHMDGLSYPCNLCGKEFRCKANLDNHISKSHKHF